VYDYTIVGEYLHSTTKLLFLAGVSIRRDRGKILDDSLGVDRLPRAGFSAAEDIETDPMRGSCFGI